MKDIIVKLKNGAYILQFLTYLSGLFNLTVGFQISPFDVLILGIWVKLSMNLAAQIFGENIYGSVGRLVFHAIVHLHEYICIQGHSRYGSTITDEAWYIYY